MTGGPQTKTAPPGPSMWLRLPFVLAVIVPLVALRSPYPETVEIFVIALVAFGGSHALALGLHHWATSAANPSTRERRNRWLPLAVIAVAAMAFGISLVVRESLDRPVQSARTTADDVAPRDRKKPPPAPNEEVPGRWLLVSVGSRIGTAIGDDGAVWKWNANPSPREQGPRIPTSIGETHGATAVSGSSDHSCAVRERQAVCWGWNYNGQVGQPSTGSRDFRRQPVAVALPDDISLVAVSAGTAHSCGLDQDGVVWCWGANKFGQCGQQLGDDALAPTRVDGIPGKVKAVAAGFHASCALGVDGIVYCWGDRELLGNGHTTKKFTFMPHPIASLRDVVAIDLGESSACAVKSGGSVWCWGASVDRKEPERPQPAGIDDAISVTAGGSHRCALRANRRVVCWGENWYGQLGDGTRVRSDKPVEVRGIENAVQISAGASESCAIDGENRMTCWGRFDHGTF